MILIGRRDRIDLPDLGISNIKAKIDTGAFGCALHCNHIEIIQRKGQEVLSFQVLDPRYPVFREERQYFTDFTDKLVKNSGGETEHRYSIKTDLIIFETRIPTEFSLTNRSEMKYPILLGRKFLRKMFLVDVTRKDISYKQKQKL